MDEAVLAFEELKEAGDIRHYGISSIRPNVIARWSESPGTTSVMMQYSLLDRRPEEECLELLRAADVGVVVRGGLAKGLLASKPAAGYLDHAPESVEAVQSALAATLDGEVTLAQNALRYCLAHPAVATIACGVRTMAQLEENAVAGRLPPLSDDAVNALRAAVPALLYTNHRREL
jgi:aryl-alcohol dehydrogenase-like predicted oxidoreductase